MNHYFSILTFLLFPLLHVSAAAGGESDAPTRCAALLPPEAKSKVEHVFPGWQVVELSLLSPDEQEMWRSRRGSQCAGVAIGEFRGPGEKSYAVVIVRTTEGLKEGKLLVLEKGEGGYEIELLREERDLSRFPVVHTGPPVKYREFYDRQKTIIPEHEVIVFELMESTATVYYYKAGEYLQLLISD